MNSNVPHKLVAARLLRLVSRRAQRLSVGCLVAILLSSGCQSTLDMTDLQNDDRTSELTDTSDIKGPIERLLPASWTKSDKERFADEKLLAEARAELAKAQALFNDEQHAEAEKAAERVAKRYEDTVVREDALFLQGEAQFAQQRYAKAQDSFDQLLVDYPSTRYMDRVSRRLFTIAQVWLDFPEVVTSSEILQVSHDSADGEEAQRSDEPRRFPDPTKAVPILPNFHDGKRPIFDTRGRAIQALKSIWMNDPTGPLADDALMLTASHYLRKGDFVESDRYFQVLREEYPKSPHLEGAFVLGSHVKLMSYQGANYDGTRLEDARQLKESALRLFPESTDRQRLRDELKDISESAAARDWARVEFYQRKGKPRSVAVYCNEIIENHPQTSYADRARAVLAELKESERLKLQPRRRLPFDLPRLVPVPDGDAAPNEDGANGPDPSDADRPNPLAPSETPEPPGTVDLTGGAIR